MKDLQMGIASLRKVADQIESHLSLYNQHNIGEPAYGTPGCLLGHAKVVLSDEEYEQLYWTLQFTSQTSQPNIYHDFTTAYYQLCGVSGCDKAGRDGAKAVAYIREWCLIKETAE